eukprot:g6122.t1
MAGWWERLDETKEGKPIYRHTPRPQEMPELSFEMFLDADDHDPGRTTWTREHGKGLEWRVGPRLRGGYGKLLLCAKHEPGLEFPVVWRVCAEGGGDSGSVELTVQQITPVTWISPEVRHSDAAMHELRQAWGSDGVVVSHNFLSAEAYAPFEDALFNDDTRAFYHTIVSQITMGGTGAVYVDASADARPLARLVEEARRKRNNNEFSYWFDRSADWMFAGCLGAGAGAGAERERPVCKLARDSVGVLTHSRMQRFLESNELAAYLQAVTGNHYTLDEWFFSRYTAGQFLGPHTDSSHTRRLAFVLQFTEQWRAHYGGLLQFTHGHAGYDEPAPVAGAIVPVANTFMIFDVSEDPPPTRPHTQLLPHAVTEVAQGVAHARIAVSGWFASSTNYSDAGSDAADTAAP